MWHIFHRFASGRLANIEGHLSGGSVTFIEADLHEPGINRAGMGASQE
jgi:hypothetical protein